MRPYFENESAIAARIKAGYGSRFGPDYVPFYEVPSSDSSGRMHRSLSMTTGRVTHLLSDAEWLVFLFIDWLAWVAELFEQVLCPREATMAAAKAAGIKHPWNRKDHAPWPMTTDAVAVGRTNDQRVIYPVEVVTLESTRSRRLWERLEIKRRYWLTQGGHLCLLIKEEVPQSRAQALQWVRGGIEVEGLRDVSSERFAELTDWMCAQIARQGSGTVGDLYRHARAHFGGVSKSTAELALKRLLVLRRVVTPMDSPVSPGDGMGRLTVALKAPNHGKWVWRSR